MDQPTDIAAAHDLQVVEACDRWLAPARAIFQGGGAVRVELHIGGDDGTRYDMVFVPPGPKLTSFLGRHIVDYGTLAVVGHGIAIQIADRGQPGPGYAAEKLGTSNLYTLTAVGTVWALMVGMDPEQVAEEYGEASADSHLPRPYASWRVEDFR